MSLTLSLTQKLLSFNTINPPGNEAECMAFLADWLKQKGFETKLYSFGEQRMSLLAWITGHNTSKPLGFTGHLDTVPLGKTPWKYDPFGGEINGGKLYGRGASDMKAAIAAFIIACVENKEALRESSGVVLYLTGGEETGCDGARALIVQSNIPKPGALIVGEPTNNYPIIGHKGALWLRCTVRGKTAHGSMPSLGINAIYLAVDALGKIKNYQLGTAHPLMRSPTMNVSRIQGSENINSVPDYVHFDMDIRSVPNLPHDQISQQLSELFGENAELTTLADLPAVLTDDKHTWVRQVYTRCQGLHQQPLEPKTMPYFTDASVLIPAFGNPPCIVLGPGEPEQAHQTDEYCLITKLEAAQTLYSNIISDWISTLEMDK
ncbi:succinyl-diaminopimelate desuccinylase [Providencia alcalifaciens]|nr:succinyl-diaminopimelate desuccinylase [Providencia alcalifaciens]